MEPEPKSFYSEEELRRGIDTEIPHEGTLDWFNFLETVE